MEVFQSDQMDNSVVGTAPASRQNTTNVNLVECTVTRQMMHNILYDMLQQMQPSTDRASKEKIFAFAKHLECALMKMAKNNKEEYLDRRTLKSRVEQILRQIYNQGCPNPSSSVGYATSNSGSVWNHYGGVTSAVSMANIQEMTSLRPNSLPRVNASFPSSRTDVQTCQQTRSSYAHLFEQPGNITHQLHHDHQYNQQQHLTNNDSKLQTQQVSGFVTQAEQEGCRENHNKALTLEDKDEIRPSKLKNHYVDAQRSSDHSSQLDMSSSFQLPPSKKQQISGNSYAEQAHLCQRNHRKDGAARDILSAKAIKLQRTCLLWLRHARACHSTQVQCGNPSCSFAKILLQHVDSCKIPGCDYLACNQTRNLLLHHQHCRSRACPVCVFDLDNKVADLPERSSAAQPSQMVSLSAVEPEAHSSKDVQAKECQQNDACETVPMDASCKTTHAAPSDNHDQQHSAKRFKVDNIQASVSAVDTEAQSSKDHQQKDSCETVRSEVMPMDTSEKLDSVVHEQEKPTTEDPPKRDGSKSCLSKQDNSKCTNDMNTLTEENVKPSVESCAESKSVKSKIKGISLIQLFTAEQVKEHILSLRQWVGQSKTKAEKNKTLGLSMNDNSCDLCAVEKLAFQPIPIYCTPCGARVKRNAMYYTVMAADSPHYVCVPCYNQVRGNTIAVDETPILKTTLEKKKNDEEMEEGWVQCDKCESWQHQICALFNDRRHHGETEYTCPNCYIQEVEHGERKPLPQTAVLGAKDLPDTILSTHIEKRLFKKLKEERQERARVQGKSYEEVPGAESLVVRVVSSVDKVVEVKPRFLDLFREENYPSEFPYKSKALLLFQKIEGVEVCIFGMYVQEFGTESVLPNQRRVYLSYLDSVKYFRPEVQTVSGEALRTFVYHEILIGYLDYCKKRGFTSCYIWACPPVKGDDYILYCHPEIQKTPKNTKLREWYLSMLKKASKEEVVVECTNLYDHFFVQSGESRAKVTTARLPYFDGDYWPATAEDLIQKMSQDENQFTKNIISKRSLKSSPHFDLSVHSSKDLLLMHKLGEIISPMKEDFIMVYLQHCCNHCSLPMVSRNRWVCQQCKNFQICDKCNEVESKRAEKAKHPMGQKEKHDLYPVAITDVAIDTNDEDGILENECFDTRQAFLNLCQDNHYQFDTLRRAKHSSMMILYHLHNPTAPAFTPTCIKCQQDIESCQGWHCNVCSAYDACNSCFSKGIQHEHELIKRSDSGVLDPKAKRLQQLRELMLHASSCCTIQCTFTDCRKVKLLFMHGRDCNVRSSGGCRHCKRIWGLLTIHARSCTKSKCKVPRCSDLRVFYSRQQQQSESRRRECYDKLSHIENILF